MNIIHNDSEYRCKSENLDIILMGSSDSYPVQNQNLSKY